MRTDYTVARRIATLTAEIEAADRRVAAECAPHDATSPVTCGDCGKDWPVDIYPSARCPYEYEHDAIAERASLTRKANAATRDAAESIAQLRDWLPPGATVYCILQHVSRSGMSRRIAPYAIVDGRPQWLAGHAARACGLKMSHGARDAIVMGGCGMDMGFALVYEISQTLYGDGYKCLGQGADGRRRCPSNYHTNHRDTIQCHGAEDASGDHVPCFPGSDRKYRLRTGVGAAFGVGAICPTCKGKGRYPNPDGPERFDLVHTDGYALRHEWL